MPQAQESQSIEAFRTVIQTTRVRVVNTVNVRSEPSSTGGDATVMLTAQPGDEFLVRQGVAWSQIGSFTWVPVEVNRQNAWIAQEGFLSLITEPVQVPISQAEIDLAFQSLLPQNAVEIVVEHNELHAVDEDGLTIGVWDWGNPPIRPARWLIAAPAQLGGFAGRYLTVEYIGNWARLVLWNGDGERINDLWRSPVGTRERSVRVKWSPTGERISVGYYGNEGGYLVLLHSDGTEIASFRTRDLCCYGPYKLGNWSPDGEWLVFSGIGNSDNPDIFKVNADGEELVQLTDTPLYNYRPSFTPGGQHIVYSEGNHLYIMDADGANRRLLASNGDLYDWSGDGQKATVSQIVDLYVLDITRGTLIRQTIDGTNIHELTASFSPDGQSILFQGYPIPNRAPRLGNHLFIMPLNQAEVAIYLANVNVARFTPDGEWIIFSGWPLEETSYRTPARYYAIRPDGTGLWRLPNLSQSAGYVEGEWQPGFIAVTES